jgi:hypothetical protein
MDCSPVHRLVSSRKDAATFPTSNLCVVQLRKKDNILMNIIAKLGPAGWINKDMCVQLTPDC